jgi:hypothetical protein
MNYVAEIAPVNTVLPQGARMFVLMVADTDAKAIETVQALDLIRHDKRVQVDLYQRDGSAIGRKVWSGLHHLRPGRPMLTVVA